MDTEAPRRDGHDGYLYNKSRMTPIDEWDHISTDFEDHHIKGKNYDLRCLMNQDDYSVLPDNTMLLPSVHREGKDTIHVQVFQLSTEVESEHRLIDTKCCSLYGTSYEWKVSDYT